MCDCPTEHCPSRKRHFRVRKGELSMESVEGFSFVSKGVKLLPIEGSGIMAQSWSDVCPTGQTGTQIRVLLTLL